MNWNDLRLNHVANIQGSGVYLNSPANGIPSSVTLDHVAGEAKKFTANPWDYRMDFMFKTVPAIKDQVGRLINSSSSDIALVQNFSVGINFFVNSLPKDTKVVLFNSDYPSLNMPFEQGNFKLHYLDFEPDSTLDLVKLETLVKEVKPEILAISHCQWLTGFLCDLETIGNICNNYNCTFVVDATQSFGAISIDVAKCNIDLLGASCYKWSLAGFGNGFIYASEECLTRFPVKTAGFNSNSWNGNIPEFIPGIKCFEPGHHDHDAFNRMHFALSQIEEIGQDNIHTRINELMDYLTDRLEQNEVVVVGDFHQENRLGIISIASKPGLFEHLANNKIETSERGGNIRLGVHYYNNEDDIDRFIDAILCYKA